MAYPYPYTAKASFVGVRLKKSTNQTLKDKYMYLHSVVVHQKYLTSLGELIIGSPALDIY